MPTDTTTFDPKRAGFKRSAPGFWWNADSEIMAFHYEGLGWEFKRNAGFIYESLAVRVPDHWDHDRIIELLTANEYTEPTQ